MSPLLRKVLLLFIIAGKFIFSQPVFGQEVGAKPIIFPLWEKGAPGFENRRNEPEQAKDYWVKNIHNPSIAVYLPPPGKSNGSAVVIFPGGGHRLLVYNSEGIEPAVFLNSLGVTAIILKYRLAREENSPYQLEKHPKEDAYRAIRMVRSHATEWNIDMGKVGVMGFSAGGEVAALVAYGNEPGSPTSADPVEKMNAHPDFQILVYPGPLFIPDTIPADAPPAFVVAANDDECCSLPVVQLLERYRKSKRPIEVHLFTKGGHGFNMGKRSTLMAVKSWPQRLTDWLSDNQLLSPTR